MVIPTRRPLSQLPRVSPYATATKSANRKPNTRHDFDDAADFSFQLALLRLQGHQGFADLAEFSPDAGGHYFGNAMALDDHRSRKDRGRVLAAGPADRHARSSRRFAHRD